MQHSSRVKYFPFRIVYFHLSLLILMNPAFTPEVHGDEHSPIPVDRTSELLNNLRLTHINDLDDNVTCPKYHYITGLRLRKDDSHEDISATTERGHTESNHFLGIQGINGFEVTCSDGIHSATTTRKLIFGKEGTWNGYRQECKKGFAVGIATELTPPSSPSLSKILNMKLHCSDNSESLTVKVTDDSEKHIVLPQSPGSRETKQFCDFGAALATIAIKADSIITITRGDLFSVADLGIKCASVVNPVNRCDLKFRWERRRNVKCSKIEDIEEVEKTGVTRNISCSFDAWKGVGFNERKKFAERTFSRYETVGMANDKEYIVWAFSRFLSSPEVTAWFALYLPTQLPVLGDFISRPNWKTKDSYIEEFDVTQDVFKEPQDFVDKLGTKEELMHSPSVHQLVAFCDIYKVGFPTFTTGIDVYFHTKIKKRLTRISFDA